jgi:chaperone BCS1
MSSNGLVRVPPVLSAIPRLLSRGLGLDPSLMISGLMLLSSVASSYFVWRPVLAWLEGCVSSDITVDSHDAVYASVKGWLEKQRVSRESRSLQVAKVGMLGARVHDVVDLCDVEAVDGLTGQAVVPNRRSIRYEAAYGSRRFWHRGRLFRFDFEPSKGSGDVHAGQYLFARGPIAQKQEQIRISCFGRSTRPIKELMECHRQHLEQHASCTTVWRPSAPRCRGYGDGDWRSVATRPSRPMRTVIMEPAEKRRIIADIHHFLQPGTQQRYIDLGIPYRRGYLFYGPAGTGKTSAARPSRTPTLADLSLPARSPSPSPASSASTSSASRSATRR